MLFARSQKELIVFPHGKPPAVKREDHQHCGYHTPSHKQAEQRGPLNVIHGVLPAGWRFLTAGGGGPQRHTALASNYVGSIHPECRARCKGRPAGAVAPSPGRQGGSGAIGPACASSFSRWLDSSTARISPPLHIFSRA